MPKDIADQYRERYSEKIDHTINLNSSTWTLQDIKRKRYDIAGFAKLINDLRGVIGFVDGSRWFIKTVKNDQTFVHEMTDEKCFNSLRYYKPFRGNNKITLEMIVKRYSMEFAYDSAEISKDNKEGIINLFQGFKYAESISNDFEPLQPFLNHIREVVCNNDEQKYDYFLKWWANIFQNVTVKNGTMPIIHGAQGSGKSFPVEVFCKLLGNFALKNVDDMDKVFGKFNSLISSNLVININEPPDANEKFRYLGKIKAKLTQRADIRENKGVDQIDCDSWANYTMTTNNPNPVQEEKGNRNIYFATNNKYCGNKAYFDNLCKPIQPVKQGEYDAEFMGLLLHYMRTQIDVTDFDAEELIRDISSRTDVEYNEQLDRQYNDLNNVDRYVVDNYQLFAEECNKENEAWNGVRLEDISVEGYKPTGIAKKLNAICDVKRKQIEGKQSRFYKLKPREQIPDLWALIAYIHHGDEENQTDPVY